MSRGGAVRTLWAAYGLELRRRDARAGLSVSMLEGARAAGRTRCQVIGGKRIDQAVVEVFLEATAPCAADAARLANEEAVERRSVAPVLGSPDRACAVCGAARRASVPGGGAREPRGWARARATMGAGARARTRRIAEHAVGAPLLLSANDLEKCICWARIARRLGCRYHHESRSQAPAALSHRGGPAPHRGGTIPFASCGRAARPPSGRSCEGRRVGRIVRRGTVELVRQLAASSMMLKSHASSTSKAGARVLAFRLPSASLRFAQRTASRSLRRRRQDPFEGPFNAEQAARELGVTMNTVHRWLRDGVLAGEQLTAGAPWQIVLTDEVRERLSGAEAPGDWVGLTETARRLGLSKSLVTYLVNTGKLAAVQATVGKRRCWRIDLDSATCAKHDFFDQWATHIARRRSMNPSTVFCACAAPTVPMRSSWPSPVNGAGFAPPAAPGAWWAAREPGTGTPRWRRGSPRP